MRFKVDENLPAEAAARLIAAGYQAATVSEQDMVGEADRRLADVCRREHCALVTLDLDFADVRTHPPEEYSGFLVLRVSRQNKRHVMSVLDRVVPLLEREPLAKRLWIVDEHGVRMHGSDEEPQEVHDVSS